MLGTPSLVLFGLVYMVPLTVFTTYGIVTQVSGGRLSVAYLVTLAAMVFTARSYARMAAAYPVAGSAYTYTQKSFGAPIGFLAGWSLLLDYLFLPMLNYLVIGIYLNAAIPAIPPWVIVIVTIAIVTVLNIVGIVSVDRANFVIIAVQAIFIVVFIVLACITLSGSGTVDLMAPLSGDGTADGFSPIFAGAAILCLSFLGFDAVSTLSEEAKDPTRTVPRAIMIATVASGIIFFVLSYVSQLGVPVQRVRGRRLGLTGRHDDRGRAVPQHLLHRRVRGGRDGIGDHVAGIGGAHPVCDGSRRHPAAQGVRPRVGAIRHARLRDPGGLRDLAACHRASSLRILASIVSFGALVAFSAVNLTVIKHYFVDGERGAVGCSTTSCCR